MMVREREKPLISDGDFRSDECIEYLKKADIVVTNPPFSLFREYLSILLEHRKKFLILGNQNAVVYKEVHPLFSARKIWLGVSPRSMEFKLPSGEMKTVNSVWFTNLIHSYIPKGIPLDAIYNKLDYPKYDNYDAIEVSAVKNIPKDYDAPMGVPITFIDKFNPRQFEIIGVAKRGGTASLKTRTYTAEDHAEYNDMNAGPVVIVNREWKRLYARFIIKAKPDFIPPKPPSKTAVAKRKRKAGIRKKYLMMLYGKQDGKCANPKCPHNEYQEYFHPDFMDLDHIVPVSKGGSDELDNLQLLCRKCNGTKSDKTEQENSDR